MSKGILLLGGGGHCASVLDSILSAGIYDKIGIVDNRLNFNDTINGIPIVGNDDNLAELKGQGYENAFVTVGSIGHPDVRENIYLKIKDYGFRIPNIIDPSAAISQHLELGEGIYIGKQCVVGSRSAIGNCVILNSASLVEHDCHIDDFAHIAPGAILCGMVSIGGGTHIGAGSVVRQGLKIGQKTMIGMGSVVLTDFDDFVTAYGNPCREMKT